MRHSLLPSLLCLAASPALAQDMIAVSWSGGVYAVDSYTATATFLGSGLSGQNGMTRDDQGTLWSTNRTGGTNYSLTTIDPSTGAATVVWPLQDLRAMANAGGNLLYGIAQGTGDPLVTIDVTTGQVTTIGPTGFGGVQALAVLGGELYAWDVSFELLRIDPTTGAATDVLPGAGTIGGDVQWLARRGDGKLVGGNNGLYEIDPATGTATSLGGSFADLRGAEPWQQATSNFGSGCYGVTSTATIVPGTNPTLQLQSSNHTPNVPGLVLFGISSTSSGGVPLPLSIDPIFGTTGCTLYVSLDVSVLAVTDANTPANLDLTVPILPSWRGTSLIVQHATLDNVAGGVSLSDAVVVQFGY